MSEAENTKSTGKKNRSPAYPFVGLEKAVVRAKAMYDKEGKHEAPFSVVAQHWGFSASSSGAIQTLAALRQFGLLNVVNGQGQDRVIQLTELARRIVLDDRETERTAALQEAALKPKLYSSLWAKWRNELASDQTVMSHMKVELEFNPGAVEGVLKDYKDTLKYAKLDLPSAKAAPPVIDDLDDDGGEEEEPMEQFVAPPQTKTAAPAPLQALTALAGETEYFRSKLAEGRTVRVLFQGPEPTQNEISKLIAMLELTKDQYPIG